MIAAGYVKLCLAGAKDCRVETAAKILEVPPPQEKKEMKLFILAIQGSSLRTGLNAKDYFFPLSYHLVMGMDPTLP